jgi:hypothetical protein
VRHFTALPDRVRGNTDTPCGVFPLANPARARYTSDRAAVHTEKKIYNDSQAATALD